MTDREHLEELGERMADEVLAELSRLGQEQGVTRVRCTCAAWSPGECCCDYDWGTR